MAPEMGKGRNLRLLQSKSSEALGNSHLRPSSNNKLECENRNQVYSVLQWQTCTYIKYAYEKWSVLSSPVIAAPATCPTADPTATPPAVAAICLKSEGCCGAAWDIMGWDGGAAAGTLDAGAGRGGGGGAAALGAARGGGAARPRRGILEIYERAQRCRASTTTCRRRMTRDFVKSCCSVPPA